ncbi:hypothetical protein SLW70_14165 [Flavobacterium sp. NG2]|uniref:hypothetical protein n=1 Tax=Flavobacterium sp. NG2 TaxID=3097547 RepID=UPI002A80F667|nr:hypothetical protein [Flavobacterium sp. NG2]WPR71069.1 hypothetical protein SLW70_14165 [Flavobacterium sp. NG2]
MKKLIVSAFLLMLTLGVTAQEAKNIEGAIKELKLEENQANQLRTFVKEKYAKVKDLKSQGLSTDEEAAKLKEINQVHFARVNKLLGKEKMVEFNNYWKN